MQSEVTIDAINLLFLFDMPEFKERYFESRKINNPISTNGTTSSANGSLNGSVNININIRINRGAKISAIGLRAFIR